MTARRLGCPCSSLAASCRGGAPPAPPAGPIDDCAAPSSPAVPAHDIAAGAGANHAAPAPAPPGGQVCIPAPTARQDVASTVVDGRVWSSAV